MPIEQDYEPKYVDLDDVPIAGPGVDNDTEYSAESKRKALFQAESELEADVNEGAELATDEVKNIHQVAVMNLATHVLTHAAEDPSDVTLGDMASGGGAISDYSSTYRETYDNLVDKINKSSIGGSGSGNFAVIVNNGLVGDDATTHTV